MILMACSGYQPSHAVSLWHEFDTIIRRETLVCEFFHDIYSEVAKKLESRKEQRALSNKEKSIVPQMNDVDAVVMSMVKDGTLAYFDQGARSWMFDRAILPGYVSNFPLEPSIHPYDGVFTGRITVRFHLRAISLSSSHKSQILGDPIGPCVCDFNDGRRLIVFAD
jgi:hypothetical protein